MLEKLNVLAQAAATNVSRRQMLGRFGRGAAMLAAALAGLLPSQAEAARGPRYPKCTVCVYGCANGSGFSFVRRGGCPKTANGCKLVEEIDCGGGPG